MNCAQLGGGYSMNCTSCISGYFPDTVTSCATCNSAISNCAACTPNFAGGAVCTTCIDKYYTSTGAACQPCTDIDANCYFCNNQGRCTQCLYGYYVNTTTYKCDPQPACSVTNCAQCTTTDGTLCVTCNPYFVISADTRTCAPPASCPNGMTFNGATCACRPGTYSTATACPTCSSNCLTCSSVSACSSCSPGYYIDSGYCSACGSYCQTCTSGTICTMCMSGYSLTSGACLVNPTPNIAVAQVGGVPVICPVGCSTCSSTTVCTSCLNGFAIQGNTCVQCDQTCLTCSTSNPQECLSCTPGQNLFSGSCLAC